MPYLQSAALTQLQRARPPAVRTTARPYTAGRPTRRGIFLCFGMVGFGVSVWLFLCSGVIYNPQERNSVIALDCRSHAVLARGEPSAELPAARARRQWFMTEEEGVRLRSSLF